MRCYKDDALLGGLLSLRREYRKHGVCLAMQLRCFTQAREHGSLLLKTCTPVQKLPLQALFNKPGYAQDPAWQLCHRISKDDPVLSQRKRGYP
jgi:hypothetical protein